jgi:hypothetical protein
VTFRYRDNRSQKLRRVTLSAEQFIHRFLLHTLPRGCAKVRYYGIWSPTCRAQLELARVLLEARPLPTGAAAAVLTDLAQPAETTTSVSPPTPARCSYCRVGHLFELRVLPPQRKVPP